MIFTKREMANILGEFDKNTELQAPTRRKLDVPVLPERPDYEAAPVPCVPRPLIKTTLHPDVRKERNRASAARSRQKQDARIAELKRALYGSETATLPIEQHQVRVSEDIPVKERNAIYAALSRRRKDLILAHLEYELLTLECTA